MDGDTVSFTLQPVQQSWRWPQSCHGKTLRMSSSGATTTNSSALMRAFGGNCWGESYVMICHMLWRQTLEWGSLSHPGLCTRKGRECGECGRQTARLLGGQCLSGCVKSVGGFLRAAQQWLIDSNVTAQVTENRGIHVMIHSGSSETQLYGVWQNQEAGVKLQRCNAVACPWSMCTLKHYPPRALAWPDGHGGFCPHSWGYIFLTFVIQYSAVGRLQ